MSPPKQGGNLASINSKISHTGPVILKNILPLKNIFMFICILDGMDTEEGAKRKNMAMAKKKFNMDPKKVDYQFYPTKIQEIRIVGRRMVLVLFKKLVPIMW